MYVDMYIFLNSQLYWYKRFISSYICMYIYAYTNSRNIHTYITTYKNIEQCSMKVLYNLEISDLLVHTFIHTHTRSYTSAPIWALAYKCSYEKTARWLTLTIRIFSFTHNTVGGRPFARKTFDVPKSVKSRVQSVSSACWAVAVSLRLFQQV